LKEEVGRGGREKEVYTKKEKGNGGKEGTPTQLKISNRDRKSRWRKKGQSAVAEANHFAWNQNPVRKFSKRKIGMGERGEEGRLRIGEGWCLRKGGGGEGVKLFTSCKKKGYLSTKVMQKGPRKPPTKKRQGGGGSLRKKAKGPQPEKKVQIIAPPGGRPATEGGKIAVGEKTAFVGLGP